MLSAKEIQEIQIRSCCRSQDDFTASFWPAPIYGVMRRSSVCFCSRSVATLRSW